MASTFSDLKIELIGTGEQVGSWGNTTNANLGTAIEEAIVGSATVTFASSDVTLTLTNTNNTQVARHLRLNLTGTSGGARNLVLGSGCQIDKPYIINNGLADAVTVKNTTGTGIAVPAGKSMWVYNNGTNVVEVSTASVTPFEVASGGTGASTLTANNVVIGNGTSAVNFVAPSTAGNALVSNGTTWISSSPFLTGMIILWSGSIASIPAGFALCNGANGTPDLRDRFVIGAGNTHAVNATGGATTVTLATANLPSHTHSLSASGTTSNQSANHNHGFTATTGNQSVNHNHAITISDPTHNHQINAYPSVTEASGFGLGFSSLFLNRPLVSAGGGSFTVAVSTGITASSGNNSANHNHEVSGTTGNNSANHNHTVTVTGTSGATGSGTAVNILNPFFALAYIMKL